MKNQELQNLVQLEIKNRESVSDIIGMNMMKRVLFELEHLEKHPKWLTYALIVLITFMAIKIATINLKMVDV